jgi:uncharacterized OB-fold protein
METKKQIPCIEGWITMPPEEPRVIGSRCEACGHYYFPKVAVCHNPACKGREVVKDVPLNRRGKLFSYTINYFQPPPPYHAPTPFTPFGIAVLDIPEGIKIVGQVPRSVDLKNLKIGMEMEVVREVLYVDPQGVEVLCWMFKPAA